jgi:leucyl/phenylalanyl-tRNA--protein transferase
MFHLKPNASKLALLELISHLSKGGADWIDIQMLTPHMKALGAKEIARSEFLERLQTSRKINLMKGLTPWAKLRPC